MVMGIGGPEFYKTAFIDLDPDALGSANMVEAFKRMEVLRGFVDDNFSGRDWNLASAMVANGEALFQIMGDWAKGEFVNAGQTAGVEFQCFRVPGTEGTVTFNSDQFAMFKVADEGAMAAQSNWPSNLCQKRAPVPWTGARLPKSKTEIRRKGGGENGHAGTG